MQLKALHAAGGYDRFSAADLDEFEKEVEELQLRRQELRYSNDMDLEMEDGIDRLKEMARELSLKPADEVALHIPSESAEDPLNEIATQLEGLASAIEKVCGYYSADGRLDLCLTIRLSTLYSQTPATIAPRFRRLRKWPSSFDSGELQISP
jgi:hypothetical protein